MEHYDEGFLEIINEEYVEGDISKFFEWTFDNESNQFRGSFKSMALVNFFEESIGNSFIESEFSMDVKISLLNEAISELQKFFLKKTNRKKYDVIFKELFYTESQVIDLIQNAGIYLSLWSEEEIPEKLYLLIDINQQIPKIKFPWLFFIFCTTMDNNGQDLNYLSERFLGLKWTRGKIGSKSNIGKNIFREAQQRYVLFMMILKKYESAKDEGYNLSLNLYCFNQATNLFDIDQVLKPILEKNLSVSHYQQIIALEGIAIKNRIIEKDLNGKLLSDISCLKRFNKVFNDCKALLRDIFKVELENEDIPNDIATAYSIYTTFSEENYDKVLITKYMTSKNVLYPKESKEFELYGAIYKTFRNWREKNKAEM